MDGHVVEARTKGGCLAIVASGIKGQSKATSKGDQIETSSRGKAERKIERVTFERVKSMVGAKAIK